MQRRDESSDVGHDQHLSDTSTDNGSETGTEPPVACQSSSQEIELPSAVDCSHAGEENTQASPQPQQGRHVPSSTQVPSNVQTAPTSQQHHNAAQGPAQPSESHRPSRRVITNWWDVDDDEIKRHQAIPLPQCTLPERARTRQPDSRKRSNPPINPATKPPSSPHRGPSPRDG